LNAAIDPKFLRLLYEKVWNSPSAWRSHQRPGGFGANARLSSTLRHGHAFSDARIGWLVAGTVPGLRVAEAVNAGGNAGSTSFPYAVELRQRTTYFGALLNGETTTTSSGPSSRAPRGSSF